jgi:hypothetical protein
MKAGADEGEISGPGGCFSALAPMPSEPLRWCKIRFVASNGSSIGV